MVCDVGHDHAVFVEDAFIVAPFPSLAVLLLLLDN